MEELTRITPNKERARSIIKMAETTLEMIKTVDKAKFPTNVTKEYYEVIRELITGILLLDGLKAVGEGAHKAQIDYVGVKYKEFTRSEIAFIDDLRITRNKIAYEGFFVKEDYITRKIPEITIIMNKLNSIIRNKM